MAQKLGESYLKDVKPFKTNWRIRIKILHMWTQYTPGFGETLDMFICDEAGCKMQATIKKAYINRFQRDLKVGAWKIIDTFSVSSCSGKYKVSKVNFKITFTNNTEVSNSDTMSDSTFLELSDFGRVKDKAFDENVLIDILGQVISVGKYENLNVRDKPTKKLDFQIRDANDERLGCTLWGKFGEKVYNACQNNNGDDKTLVLIRFAKINSFKGNISITNAFEASDVLINPLEYREVEELMAVLPSDGLCLTLSEPSFKQNSLVLANTDNFIEYPRKTIAELCSSSEIGKWRILATICGIDTDWGWYYISHRDCNKKVELEKVSNSQIKPTNKFKKPKFWCENCFEHVTNVIARYKLHVNVMDQTGDTKLMLFDSFAAKLISKPASELIDGRFEEIEDPTIIPDAISNLRGKTFQFLTTVEKDNVNGGKDFYKVARVWLGNEITKEEYDVDNISMNDPSSQVSPDEDILMLTNSSDNSNGTHSAMSTPSKRSNVDMTEIIEQSSSTKKIKGMSSIDLNQGSINESIKSDGVTKEDGADGIGKQDTNNDTTVSAIVSEETVRMLKVKQERFKD